MNIETTELINDYEKKQLAKIEKWQQEEPGVVAQAINLATKPIAWAVTKVITPNMLKGAILNADSIANSLTDKNDIIRDGGVNNINELRSKDLALSDKLSFNVSKWAVGIATAEGAATGATGILGMAADIPIVITLALRTIHKIGLCYGYECDNQDEQLFALNVMSAAGANSMQEKYASQLTIQRLAYVIAKNSWKKLAEKAAESKFSEAALIMAIKTTVSRLCPQLAKYFTKRKIAQIIPGIGAAVGAAANAAFINDITKASIMCFRQRWLAENNKITIEIEEQEATY